jgi:ribonuclease VapC
MIVVDSSALVAIGQDEPDADDMLYVLETSVRAIISPVNAVEAGLVLIGRGIIEHPAAYDRWLRVLDIEVDHERIDHALAIRSYLTFGRGYHPAKLNFGDCFAYALAKRMNAPLLFKGNDFAQTDICSALQPT